MKELEKVLHKLAQSGLKVNTYKSLFGITETEYIVLWVSNQGGRPLSSKSEAINKIDVPTKLRDIHRFMGLVRGISSLL